MNREQQRLDLKGIERRINEMSEAEFKTAVLTLMTALTISNALKKSTED